MRPQFSQVCQSCAAGEQRESVKAGTNKAYMVGAGVVGITILIFILRVLLRMASH